MTLDSLLEQATERHRAGAWDEARRLYARILGENPTHATALFQYGLLELQNSRPQAALELLQRSAANTSPTPRHDAALGQVMQALGRFAEAAAAHRRVLAADPASVDAHFSLGVALQSLGDHAAAAGAYQHALELQPDHFAALNNLGNCQQRGADLTAAIVSYERALILRPGAAGTMANLGTALQGVGRLEEAVHHLRTAAAAEPAATAHAVNLGIALCRMREFGEAEAVLRQALAQDPHCVDAMFNLANALSCQGRRAEAAQLYRHAIAIRPDHADALVNLGNIHRDDGDHAAAAAAYAAAMKAAPDTLAAFNNSACLLRSRGELDAAEDMLRGALQRFPDHPVLYDNLGSVLKDAGEIDAAIDCFRRSLNLDAHNPATHSNLAYALSFQADTAQPVIEECRRWNDRHAVGLARPTHPRSTAHAPARRLRIGYVSPDFREHCQSLFTIPLLTHHDRQRFEIFAYSSVVRPDPVTARIAALVDVWRDVRTQDDAAVARCVQGDEIDILVDLTMHMSNGRPLLFARKPAPIQVAWLAYPGTTGLDAMDYRISDPRLDPPAGCAATQGESYVERTLYLDTFWCYDPLCTEPAVNPLPALQRGHLTFGCLNNPCKLTDATLDLWGAVMRALPDARLTLLAPHGRHRLRLAQRLRAVGIGEERVAFVPYRSRKLYLRYYHDIDIGLDTTPYNGHTTSLDSLWMGVPTISRIGATCVGRGGLSQLFQLGLDELAAESEAEFVQTAVALSRDLPRLAHWRQELRPRLERSALMNAPRFARNLETLFMRIWREHCEERAQRAAS